MSNERSVALHLAYREGALKFDYFVTGLTAAVFAYVGQRYEPQVLAFDTKVLEPLALILLLVSLVLGLKRIERSLEATKKNAGYLEADEIASQLFAMAEKRSSSVLRVGGLVISGEANLAALERVMKTTTAEIEKATDKENTRSYYYYQGRNWTFLLGFVALLSSRILSVY